MDIFVLIIVGVGLVVVPLALFLGIIAVAILIWSWRRIGPYFVNLGRWSADWKNFLPLSCAGLVGVVLLIILAAVLPDILRYVILGILILGAVIFIIFATIVWTVRFLHWFWPRYRIRFWNAIQWFWDLVWKGIPGQVERRMPGGPAATRRPPPTRPLSPKPPSAPGGGPTASAASQPPVRKSWLDLEWLSRLIWGSPQAGQRRPVQPKPSTGQASEPAVVAADVTKPAGRPKAGIKPLTWRLGLLVARVRSMVVDRPAKKGGGAAAPVSSQPVPAPAQPVVAGPQARKVAGRKKNVFESMSERISDTADSARAWLADLGDRFRRKPKVPQATTVPSSKVSAKTGPLQSVRKSLRAGQNWVADRGRASVDSLRRLLRLNKKQR